MSSRLVIREEQMEALEDAMLCRWLCDYLESCYPGRSQELGRGALSEQVRAAIGRARARGIEADQDIKKYVHVEFLLGPEFAEDPELSWARRILEDPGLEQPGQRVRALEEATLRYAETTAQSAGRED